MLIDVGPPNTPPTCTITSPAPDSAGLENQEVTFTATVSDVNIPSQDLSISWSSNHDGTIGTSVADSAGNVVFSYSGLSINDHTITLVVQDEIEAECTVIFGIQLGHHLR